MANNRYPIIKIFLLALLIMEVTTATSQLLSYRKIPLQSENSIVKAYLPLNAILASVRSSVSMVMHM